MIHLKIKSSFQTRCLFNEYIFTIKSSKMIKNLIRKSCPSKSLYLLLLIFVVSSSSYNYAQGKYLVHMSAIAYQSPQNINAWNCTLCSKYIVSHAKTFVVNDIQGFTGFSQTTGGIIVAFRGSDNFQNWVRDLDFAKVKYDGCSDCQVHEGFLKAYNTVKAQMLYQVQQLKAIYRYWPITVTGHSLGGALAVLAVPDLIKIYGAAQVLNFCTFGQPRVGNRDFARYIDYILYKRLPLSRVIHYADLVPHLPPESLGFEHSGQEVWFDSDMQYYQICWDDMTKCSDSLTIYSLSDHSMVYYLKIQYGLFNNFFHHVKKFVDKLNSLTNLRTV